MNFNKNYHEDNTSLKTFYKFVLKLILSKIFITEYRIMKNLQLFKNYQIFQACLSTKFKKFNRNLICYCIHSWKPMFVMFQVKTNHRKLFVYTLFQMKTSHCWPKPEIWSISLASAATSPKQYLASVRDDAVSEEGVLALKFVTRYFSIRSLHRLVCSSACNTPSNFCRCFTRSLRVYGVFSRHYGFIHEKFL